MLQNKWRVSTIMLLIISCLAIFLLGFDRNVSVDPLTVYTVYLDGKAIGVLDSKSSFEEFINVKEEQLKKKYDIAEVYTPKGVEIKKTITYDKTVNSNEEIYNKIISNKKFTVQGYEINIISNEEEKEDVTIYVLSKDIFDEAIENTIKAFIDKDEYEKFMSGSQEEIKDTGSIIENIDFSETITYKDALISTDENIFTDVDELSKYLLYGTLDSQDTYMVKAEDTIESIANMHKLNVQEFLIANPEFTSENNLLYESQEVVVGLIKPIISVVVDVHSVTEEEKAYDTEVQYDPAQYIGYQSVLREGENGLYKITRKSQYVNGQLVSATISNSSEIKPSINRVVVKGEKYAPNVADLSYWAWPTDRPYTITSYYEYRWGSFHDALDIYVGHGSPIYAANNGVVYKIGTGCTPGYTSCNGRQGNYILINHNAGGYYTIYMHLKDIYVSEGQTVARGQKIASMGNTGNVYPIPSSSNPYGGTHLHFGVRVGSPYGGTINPLNLY